MGLYVFYLRGFITPGVIDEELCIDTEDFVEKIFVCQGDVAHGVYSVFCQTPCGAGADAPEIRDWLVVPELRPVAHLIQLTDEVR